ncbi:MAG: Undecaprenyl-diphosphatase [Firmicutes bacterium ADurb.Bin419]|nr:MAG: Undecaprenyl-diphosphatase [Firmicutes bacterium ADurb.Bin419]
MEIIKAIILGIIEGITEWLPISSTGHMILADEFIKLNMSDKFKEMFFVVIQLGAILAVILLYWNKLFPISLKRNLHVQKDKVNLWEKILLHIKKDTVDLWMKVIVAILPAALIGIPFDDKIDELFYNYKTVTATLIIYGVLFILLEKRNKTKKSLINNFDKLSYKTAAIIGVFQVLALIPGTSRSGATILGAILIGCSREIAAEFSFFLAIPIMFGASLLKVVKFGLAFTGMEFAILVTGMIVAFIISILAIKFLVGYIKKNDFTAFGYYRIVLGLLVVGYFLAFR